MQHSKSFIYSIYTLFLSVYRLLLLTISLSSCLLLTACKDSVTNIPKQQKSKIDRQQNAININQASAAELESLPGIGKVLAQRIVEHRARYGKFRRTENLILVNGMSDKKYRELQSLITAD